MIGLTVRRPSSFSTPVAFTLVEVLVATSVLVLLILVVSQLVQSATRLITGNHQHIDADDQARLMLDRMALDFGRMLKRQDVDYIFASQTRKRRLLFLQRSARLFRWEPINPIRRKSAFAHWLPRQQFQSDPALPSGQRIDLG